MLRTSLSTMRLFGWLALCLVVTSCTPAAGSPQPTSNDDPLKCTTVAAPADPAGDDPDFGLYGFPRVGSTARFTPGQAATVTLGNIVLTLPADLHTEALEFDLLVGETDPWQQCVGDQQVVMVPYAYRVREVASGKRVGRFDQPVTMTVTDPKISSKAVYWSTTATSPATAGPSSGAWSVEGTTLKVTNGNARRGWFVTVPRA